MHDEKKMRERWRIGFLVSLIGACAGCATARAAGSAVEPIVLTADTKQISGWLYAAGELSVMGTRDPEKYDPYPKDQALRCVSLINETGVAYRDLSQLNLKHVVVTGYVLNYDDLPIGQDQFMVRRYWKDKVLVRNSCVRDQVFVATAIEAK